MEEKGKGTLRVFIENELDQCLSQLREALVSLDSNNIAAVKVAISKGFNNAQAARQAATKISN
jgi:hypothetical protein